METLLLNIGCERPGPRVLVSVCIAQALLGPRQVPVCRFRWNSEQGEWTLIVRMQITPPFAWFHTQKVLHGLCRDLRQDCVAVSSKHMTGLIGPRTLPYLPFDERKMLY
jgi:hypothetical protein